ncbi:extracellular triacylglycerol lipase precursor [Mycena polygramma]|nr:extracellular triacylglycerol lipase precursor [Mycena polygramma]
MVRKLSFTSLVLFAGLCNAAPTVQLGSTTVTGAAFSNLEFFGGIPYAEPPVGGLRLKPPVPLHNLGSSTFNASQYGNICLQPGTLSDENCLTINIYRPAGIKEAVALPVMAFIHGGGYSAGSSASYNATAIVAQSIARGTPVIYVSFNYRLGPLGFPTGREALAKGALNLALKDQLLALRWVQDNIAAFRGDKSKVTLFGESAGAMSIGALYLHSNLQNLVRAAIFESGSAASLTVLEASTRQLDWDNFVRAVPGCNQYKDDSFACLRNANSSVLVQAMASASAQSHEVYPWAPVIDGPEGLLPELPSVLMEKGNFARIPFIAGTNLDQGTYFTTPLVNSTAFIESYLIANYTTPTVSATKLKTAIEKLLQLYPDVPALGSPYNTGNETFGLSSQFKRFSAMMGDLWFQSPRRAWMQAADNFGVKTFGYLFTDPGAPPIAPPTLGLTAHAGAAELRPVTHTAELIYIYGLEQAFGLSASASVLGTQIIDYWVSFAVSLNPNDGLGSTRPNWSQYTSSNKVLLELSSVNMTMISDDYHAQQIDFINSNLALFSR